MEINDVDKIISEVVGKTNSELILSLIVIVVGLVVFTLPLYVMTLRGRKEQSDQKLAEQAKWIEREQIIIQVVKANTEVMSEIKSYSTQ